MDTDPHLNHRTLFGVILDASVHGLVLYEARGPCVWANEAAARIVGGTREQLLRQDFRTIPSWQRSGLIASALEALESGQTVRHRASVVTTFGKHVDVEVAFGRVEIDGGAYLLIGYEDRAVGLATRGEEGTALPAFRRTLADLQAVMDRHPDAILVVDASQRVRFANPQAAVMLETTPEALLGSSFALPIRGLAGSDLDIVRANGRPGRGQPRVEGLEWQGKPAWLVTIHDVSDLRQAEAEALQSGTCLGERRGREALDRLAGSVAHQLNNQLMVLRGHLEMIDDGPRDWAEVTRRLPVMLACLDTLEALGRGVMDVGRRQPVGDSPGEAADAWVLPRAILHEPPTILLAEDEEPLRAMVAEVLVGRGFRVIQAAHGTEAVERASAHEGPLALLLTDVDMPGMDGVDLHETLAALRPGLPVLFMSGYAESDYHELHAVAAQGRYMQKPFSLRSLVHRVERILAGS